MPNDSCNTVIFLSHFLWNHSIVSSVSSFFQNPFKSSSSRRPSFEISKPIPEPSPISRQLSEIPTSQYKSKTSYAALLQSVIAALQPSQTAPVVERTSNFSSYYTLQEAEERYRTSISNRQDVSSRINSLEPLPIDSGMDVDDDQDRRQQLLLARKQPLNEEESRSATSTINGPRTHEVVIDKFNIDMTRYKIGCLRRATWLNDEVVNFYMSMLQERDERLCTETPGRLSSHYFSSFFLTKLLERDTYNYSNVKRWTKKFDVLSKDKIFCPVNISNTHWTMAVVFVQRKEIVYYDSMSASGQRYLQALLRWIKDDAKDKKQIDLDVSEWKLIDRQPNVPQQENGYDCGVFCITCADYVSDDLPLDYDQDYVTENRTRIAAAILRGSLNY